MMLLSQSICSILLALSFLFDGAYGKRGVIAYRTVSQREARKTNKYGMPYRGKVVDQKRRRLNSLGPGYYTSNKPGGWMRQSASWFDGGAPWYCAIEADIEKVEDLSKVWIPKSYLKIDEDGEMKTKKLWTWNSDNEKEIHKYIKLQGVRDPENALLFSHIQNEPGKVQMKS
ncbi:uncharacterized protein L3040_003976 [Drepanopeziza brunnea f. sp. 'multigermtubi']|uniref:uncharacterized protein n=1 Tax=Drepanopeziza brunnea f. sp. 'multigermtubi' TaxID=698441 RepID=UPI0023831CB2|nr:hypothetical protein L3040_003976 [Drepanopeziza brunnea f. sp. 'multigermtubi']